MVDLYSMIDQYKDRPEEIYPESFFKMMQRPRAWQKEIGKAIGKKYGVKSAIDFGCGLGYYLDGLYDSGANVAGIEFMYKNAVNYLAPDVSQYIKFGNVMEPIGFDYYGMFDLSMSVEVAEHILTEKSDVFVQNLTRTSTKYVFLTAAPPGQGGDGHINEQDKSFWIEKMKKNGFEYNGKETNELATIVGDIKGRLQISGRYINIIKKNLMFFNKV